MTMKHLMFIVTIAAAVLLSSHHCGAKTDASTAVTLILLSNDCNSTIHNDLFNQPQNDGDATCGIRQTLISQKVLIANTDYTADILAMWERIYAQTMTDYPHGMPKNEPDVQLTQLFERALPEVYTEDAVRAANGGPLTPPSSILNNLKEDGYSMVRYYVDEQALFTIFGSDFVTDELSLFAQEFPSAPRVAVDASAESATLRALFTQPDSYYIVVVNEGMHWIGVTATTVYDSLGSGPIATTNNFGKLNGDPTETRYNSFTGLVIEVQKNN